MEYQVEQNKEISIKCFGKLAIYVDGIEQSVQMKSMKARELIAFLLTYKGEAVSKTTVCNALWEDKPEEYGKDSFYKLVKKVEKMPIPFKLIQTRGMIQLQVDNIECDIIAFEKLLEEGKIEEAEKAVDLYRGTLFEEENYNWAYMKEASYDNKYIETLEHLQNHFKVENEPGKERYYKTLMDNYM